MSETVHAVSWPLRVVIILGIIFVLPATVNYGIATFIGKPEGPTFPSPLLQSSADKAQKIKARQEYNKVLKDYRTAQKAYAHKAFWISLPVGLIVLCAGFFPGLSDAGIGLMGAGLVTVGMAHLFHSSAIGDPERFASLLLGLVLLLLIAYRRLLRPG